MKKPSKTEQDLDALYKLVKASWSPQPKEHWHGKPKRLTVPEYLELKKKEIIKNLENKRK